MIKSVSYDQHEILKSIIDLHVGSGVIDCDLTYGNGAFYKQIDEPLYCYDIDPQHDHVIKADSADVPLESGCLYSVVFDPPFLCDLKKGRQYTGSSIMSKRFSGYDKFKDLEKHYIGTIKEAARLLAKKGIFIFKCQDTVHWHKFRCIHNFVINESVKAGFRLKDTFILLAKHRLPLKGAAHGIQNQQHARSYHAYFLVFIKEVKI